MNYSNAILRCCVMSIALLLGNGFVCQKPNGSEKDTIYWNQNIKLTWNDFKCPAPIVKKNENKHSASTNSGIKKNFYPNNNQDSIFFLVKSYFNKKNSYYRVEDATLLLLQHEQLHFDITELTARRLRKAIALTKFNYENYKSKADSLYKNSTKERETYQHLYDEQTNHSKVKLKQKEWEKKIAKELKELDMYSDILIKAKLY